MPNSTHGNGSDKSFHGAEKAFGILVSFLSEGENLFLMISYVSIFKVSFFFPLKKSCYSNNHPSPGSYLSTYMPLVKQADPYATWKAREKHVSWKRLTKW